MHFVEGPFLTRNRLQRVYAGVISVLQPMPGGVLITVTVEFNFNSSSADPLTTSAFKRHSQSVPFSYAGIRAKIYLIGGLLAQIT